MRELSYMGASVLQEEAIFPVREVNIPIQIKNTNRPQDEGTIIRESAEAGEDEHLITGIAGKRDFVSVHIKKAHMSGEVGLVRKTLAIFERYGVSVEHIPTGVDSFGVIVNGADVRDSIYSIIRQGLWRPGRRRHQHPHDHPELSGDLHHHGRQQRGLRACHQGHLRPLCRGRDGLCRRGRGPVGKA